MNIVLFCLGQPALARSLKEIMATSLQIVHDATEHAATADEFIEYLRSMTDRASGSSCFDVLVVAASRFGASPYEKCARVIKDVRRAGFALPVVAFTDDDPAGEAELLMQGANYCVGNRELSVRPCAELLDAVLATVAGRSLPGKDIHHLITIAGLALNTNSFQVSAAGSTVRLTVRETLLLEALMRHPGHVFARDRLVTAMWGSDIEMDDRNIDSHVKRLRRKLRKISGPNAGDCIETVYGGGYMLAVESVTRHFPKVLGRAPQLAIAS